MALLARSVGGLLVILVLIALAARAVRRSRGRSVGDGLRVVERGGLSKDAALAVVEVHGRSLLLGVTSQGVSMLADLNEPQDVDEAEDEQHEPGVDAEGRIDEIGIDLHGGS